MKVFKQAALIVILAVFATFALARSEGLYNPSSNAVGDYQGIDSNKPASGTTFSITFESATNSTTAANTYSFASQSIGTADPTRIVVVGISCGTAGGGATSVTQLTIGGSNATQATGAAQGNTVDLALSDIWYLAVTTGTTATIGITLNGGLNASRCAISIYSVLGSGDAFSTASGNITGSSVNTLSATATIPAGGGAIGIANIHTLTPGAVTGTNLNIDAGGTQNFGSSSSASGNSTTGSGSTAFSFNWAGTAATAAISVATFSP